MDRKYRRPRLFQWPVIAMAGVTLLVGAAHGAIEGISYTLQPTYSFLQWDTNVPLKNTEMYGGRIGVNFGRYVSLTPYYLLRGNVRTEFGRVGLENGAVPLPEGRVDLRNYGANVVLSTGGTNVAPFLRGGAGVMEFRPDAGGRKSQQINVNAGGGLRFGLSRLLVELYAEDTAFRLNRYQLAGLNTLPDPQANRIRHNLAFGGSLNFKLGGYDGSELSATDRAVADRFRNGLHGLSIPVEVYGGKLDFKNKLGLKEQNLAGLRTGLDFGPYVGLRAFYWRGMNDSFDDTERIQSFGGEARFNLATGQGAIPYLVLGAGQLDFMNGYLDKADSVRADRSLLILGGGVAFSLGDRLRLNVGARDNLMTDRDIKDVASADELRSNWMFSAGLGFNLFGGSHDEGSSRDASRRENPVRADSRDQRSDRPMIAGAPPDHERRRGDWELSGPAEWDSLGQGERAEWRARRMARHHELRDGRWRPDDEDELESDDDHGPDRGPGRGRTPNYAGERMVAFPVPREGEVYIRYGKPGAGEVQQWSVPGPGLSGPSEEDIRNAIRDELGRLNAPGAGGTSNLSDPQQMELLERRIMDRLNQKRDADRLDDRPMPPAGGRRPSPPDERAEDRLPPPERPVDATPAARIEEDTNPPGHYEMGFQGLRVYVGDNLSEPSQFVGGGRINFGGLSRDSRLNFLPEVAVGSASDASSFLAAGNLQLDLKRPDVGAKFGCYAYGGFGFLHTNADDSRLDHSGFVVNLGAGAEYLLLPTVPFFVELQGVDLFDQTRLLFGLRYRQ